MANTISNSPITLTPDRAAWKSIPEVPIAVQDAFGPKASVMGQHGRWCALVPRSGSNVFARLDGREVKPSGVTTSVFFSQSLESDASGRVLVIGGKGESLYAVDASCAATCLGVVPEDQKIRTACWLPRGGVAALIGSTVAIYTPGPDGRLLARLRFDVKLPDVMGMRCLNLGDQDSDVIVLGLLGDSDASFHAIPADAQVRTLASFDGLVMADIRMFLDETGNRTWLPDDAVSTNGDLTRIGGIADALGMLDQLPLTELSFDPAPELAPGPDIPAPGAEVKLEVAVAMAPDALTPPSLDRFGPLTAALIKMLRAAPKRSNPDMEVLKLIREGMPGDLRAYVHAWACHGPNNPCVYEFWMGPPRVEGREFIREHAGDCLSIGTFASGEPIVGRLSGGGSCEVVMIDEEGQPYRYYGLEGFLRDLQMRAPDDWAFELDAWMD